MPYVSMDRLLPETAAKETRCVFRLEDGEVVRTYGFLEMFCDEPGCDCRRVFIHVRSDEPGVSQPRATIAWGWEPAEFYREWARFPLDDDDLHDLKGPSLPRLTAQSEEAEELLEQFQELLEDESYRARIVRHYEAFRALVEKGEGRATGSKRGKTKKRRRIKRRR